MSGSSLHKDTCFRFKIVRVVRRRDCCEGPGVGIDVLLITALAGRLDRGFA